MTNRYIPENDEILKGLMIHGYIADHAIACVIRYAILLEKPLLIEGPAGAGKTELAKALSGFLGRELLRLQCYEGIDESKALYEWNYQKQLLHIQAQNTEVDRVRSCVNIYSEEFLLERPLLKSIRSNTPQVLLIDEIDKSDEEFESFLLEILSDWQITIPEIGTIKAKSVPFVLLTSNSSRNLSEALRRRCLYLYLDYPNEERELAILRLDFPNMNEHIGKQVIAFVRRIRLERIKKHPSISEVLDWVRALEHLQIHELTETDVKSTINILLKHKQDCEQILEIMTEKGWLHGNDHS